MSLGIKATNGVVIASEKKSPTPLVDATTINKIKLFSNNIGCAYSGMGPDFRVLQRRVRYYSDTTEQFMRTKHNIQL